MNRIGLAQSLWLPCGCLGLKLGVSPHSASPGLCWRGPGSYGSVPCSQLNWCKAQWVPLMSCQPPLLSDLSSLLRQKDYEGEEALRTGKVRAPSKTTLVATGGD